MPFASTCLSSGYQTLRDVPSIEADQTTSGTAALKLVDPGTGLPIDLTDYASSSSSWSADNFTGIVVRMKEMPEDPSVWADIVADISGTPDEGNITFDYDEDTTELGGIYTAEAQLWLSGSLRRTLPFFFIVNHNLTNHEGGQLTIAEIRMTLRDCDPEMNFLTDQLAFTRQEYALAMRRCIDYWNESLPPVGTYTTTNFPYRYHYSRGVISQLYFLAGQHMMRNELDYSAGGVSVKDTDHWKNFEAIGAKLWEEWKTWVRDVKYNINVMGGIVFLGGYRQSYYSR
jgi:hypothetical protein